MDPSVTPRHPLAPDQLSPITYSRVFETPEGELVLDELNRIFRKAAVVEGGIDAILKTYRNEGSRRVLDFILLKINLANGVQDNATE